MDARTALPCRSVLTLGGKDYTILSEIGRGASCIVYDAQYPDAMQQPRRVRIRECCPYAVPSRRLDSGMLSFAEEDAAALEAAKQDFRYAFAVNGELLRQNGMTNSLSHMYDLYEANGTLYTVMSYQEGSSYDRTANTSPAQLLRRIRSITVLLQKYHDAGYLYLDMKPQNVLILPETDEMITLFDFDSTVKMQDLRSGRYHRISYSPGYCAPELMQGRIDRIDPTTDIYSVGVLLFFELFGRTPKASECRYDAVYPIEQLQRKYPTYPPKFFAQLEGFFHRTMVTAQSLRYENMRQVTAHLENILSLCAPNLPFIRDNFSYHAGCFVGRQDELREMEACLENDAVLFLHGVGGIGKTELACRYMQTHRSECETAVTVHFIGSIRQTLLSQLQIENFSRDEEESEEKWFDRMMHQMQASLTENDIFLLDNFDVENDPDLERLLQCKCRFLITTREDFRDYDYPQLEVDAMRDPEQLKTLFCYYNDRLYSEAEWNRIFDLFAFVEHHTMMIALLSKYLRVTGEDPVSLYARIREAEGINQLDDTAVKQRKDRKLRPQSVEQHLLTLFDLSGFTETETMILRSLSLLGGLYVDEDTFLHWIGMAEDAQPLTALIRRGWIQPAGNKIILHQIILDLIHKHLDPRAENCRALTISMTDYAAASQDCIAAERAIRRRVLQVFNSRISGEDRILVRYYMSFTAHVAARKEIIERCLALCLRTSEQYHAELSLLYRYQARELAAGLDIFEYCDEIEKQNALLDTILDCYARSEQQTEQQHLPVNELARCKLDLAEDAQSTAGELESALILENETMDRFYRFVQQKYEQAVEYMEHHDTDPELLARAYYKTALFFGENDYTELYRWDHFRDPQKKLYYVNKYNYSPFASSKIAEQEWELDYLAIAEDAIEKGDYETAITCCDAARKDAILTSDEERLASCYRRAGQYEKAIELLEYSLHEYPQEGDAVYRQIIDICMEAGDRTRALAYCTQFIRARTDALPQAAIRISLYWKYAELTEDRAEQSQYRHLAEQEYRTRPDELEQQRGLAYFLLQSAALEPNGCKPQIRCRRLLLAGRLFHESCSYDMAPSVLHALLHCAPQLPRIEQQAAALLHSAELLSWYDQLPETKQIYRMLLSYLADGRLQEAYLRNWIYAALENVYEDEESGITQEIKQQCADRCDHRIPAEKATRRGDRAHAVKAWLDAAEASQHAHTEHVVDCYEQALRFWEPIIDTEDTFSAYNYIETLHRQISFALQQERFALCAEKLEQAEALLLQNTFLSEKDDKRIETYYLIWELKENASDWEQCLRPDRACQTQMKALLIEANRTLPAPADPPAAVLQYGDEHLRASFFALLRTEMPDEELLDDLIEACEKMFDLSEHTDTELHRECAAFLQQRRNQIIDFKQDP